MPNEDLPAACPARSVRRLVQAHLAGGREVSPTRLQLALARIVEDGGSDALGRYRETDPAARQALEQAARALAGGWTSRRWGPMRPFAVPLLFVSRVDWDWPATVLEPAYAARLGERLATVLDVAAASVRLDRRLWRAPADEGPLRLAPLLAGGADDRVGGRQHPLRPSHRGGAWLAYLRGRLLQPAPPAKRLADRSREDLTEELQAGLDRAGLLDVQAGPVLVGVEMMRRVERSLLTELVTRRLGLTGPEWLQGQGRSWRARLTGRRTTWGVGGRSPNHGIAGDCVAVDLGRLGTGTDWPAALFGTAAGQTPTLSAWRYRLVGPQSEGPSRSGR